MESCNKTYKYILPHLYIKGEKVYGLLIHTQNLICNICFIQVIIFLDLE